MKKLIGKATVILLAAAIGAGVLAIQDASAAMIAEGDPDEPVGADSSTQYGQYTWMSMSDILWWFKGLISPLTWGQREA